MRPRLKPPVTHRLKLKCDVTLSNSAFKFNLRRYNTAELCFRNESTVLRIRAPTKIFGDLHGQFGDLMRLFAEYGSPSTAGDIAYIDYLFLGDYVDRGAFSLETISLLLALKIEHPENVHLLRVGPAG